jgi:hypothetical protein
MSAVFPRDIHQLWDDPAFGVIAVDGLINAEAALQDALRYVPYCDDHRDAWSPAFNRFLRLLRHASRKLHLAFAIAC